MSGPGIVVCEPVAVQADSATARLGTGCAMWLQFTVGGHGELGQTPLWSSLERCRRELGRKDLRVSAAETTSLSRGLGVTHAAVGRVEGTAGRCTLTYRLLELPGLKPVGVPIRLTGKEAQVVAGLPGVARTLLSRLHVTAPRVPAATGATPADLSTLAGFGWLPDRLDPRGSGAPLRVLAERIPLAALLWFRPAAWISDEESSRIERLALAAAPENALLCAAAADANRRVYAPLVPAIERGRKRFPHNALYVWSETWRRRVEEDWKREASGAELLVRCAPRNPEAWLTLGKTIGESADRLRQGRFISQMTEAELRTIYQIYDRWVPPLQRATQLDPQLGRAWHRLAVAATFAGEEELADGAIQNAIKLDENRYEVWWWALEMYSPKWREAPQKLQQIAEQAAADRNLSIAEMTDLVLSLRAYAQYEPAGKLSTEAQRQAWAGVEKEPNSAEAHLELGRMLHTLANADIARPKLQRALELDPDGPIGQSARALLEGKPE